MDNQEINMANKEPAAWFWQNYNDAMKWKNQHHEEYWKARCEALEVENTYLYKCIESMQKNHDLATSPNTSISNTNSDHTVIQKSQMANKSLFSSLQQQAHAVQHHFDRTDIQMEEDDEEDGEIVFEVNEEMLAFFETSAKHKMELKQQREAEEQKQEDEMKAEGARLQFPQQSIQQRRDEMERLYGPAGAMILSMETAMQLSFDRFNDRYQPDPWPNIPLNL